MRRTLRSSRTAASSLRNRILGGVRHHGDHGSGPAFALDKQNPFHPAMANIFEKKWHFRNSKDLACFEEHLRVPAEAVEWLLMSMRATEHCEAATAAKLSKNKRKEVLGPDPYAPSSQAADLEKREATLRSRYLSSRPSLPELLNFGSVRCY